MDAPIRAGRWLVSGALGLAVLGVGGCATQADPDVKQAGPAVVVNAGVDVGPVKPPVTIVPGAKAAGAIEGKGTDTGTTAPTTKAEPDGQAKKVPAAKPRPLNDSPASPKSPLSARSPRSANTP